MTNPWNKTMDRIGAWATTLAEIPEDSTDADRLWRLLLWAAVLLSSFGLALLVTLFQGR